MVSANPREKIRELEMSGLVKVLNRKENRSLNSVQSREVGFDPEAAGYYHKEMFRLHDLKKWDELEENSKRMMVTLGYSQENAENASRFVLDAYREADSASDAQKSGDAQKEEVSYQNTLNNFLEASKCLRSDIRGLRHKIGWYKWERHNKPLLVAYYLFREHLKRFGILRFGLVISTTWTAFLGGYFAHKKHDWEKLEKIMVKYWRYIRRVYTTRPPIQI
jgi:hypothetical protein